MRKRFNRVAVASSNCYSSSKKAHVAYLEEQHNNNSVALLAIANKPVVINELKKFESNLVAQIAAYKEGKKHEKYARL